MFVPGHYPDRVTTAPERTDDRLPAADRLGLRTRIALHAGRLAGGLSRRLGRGSGVVVRGRVVLALDPGALGALASGRRSVVITGTNGKSTTTRLVAGPGSLGPS